MTKRIRFYKENSNRWYADIPEWEGAKAELEMVEGADTMLNMIDNNTDNNGEVFLSLSTEKAEGWNHLTKTRDDETLGGAWYILDKYSGIQYNMEIWLCDVTKFIYGDMPNNLYFY